MRVAFWRWCAGILVCALVSLPVGAQEGASAAKADELKTTLERVMAAIKADDTKGAEMMVNGFMLPHPAEWFAATFGEKETPALEKVFAKLQANQTLNAMNRLTLPVRGGKTQVTVYADDSTPLLKAALAAMVKPTAIYFARIADGPDDRGPMTFGNFVYAEGGFRYLDNQVLSALSTAPPMRVAMGGNIAARNLIHREEPTYPESAGEGVVKLRVLIGTDGTVNEVTDLGGGNAALTQAAIDAVKQWRYKPMLLNGKAVEVNTEVDVTFSRRH